MSSSVFFSYLSEFPEHLTFHSSFSDWKIIENFLDFFLAGAVVDAAAVEGRDEVFLYSLKLPPLSRER